MDYLCYTYQGVSALGTYIVEFYAFKKCGCKLNHL